MGQLKDSSVFLLDSATDQHALDKGVKLVVFIEPAPDNIECLQRNFAEEPY